MEPIEASMFQKKIRYAQMICAPKYGYYVEFAKSNPYKKTLFQLPEGSAAFLSSHHFGERLTLKKDGKTELIAFLFDHDFLPPS